MNKIIFFLILIFLSYNILGQKKVSQLKIGDTFKNYSFKVTQGDSIFNLDIKSIKEKAIIIDLWDIHCAGCISGMYKLDSIQQKYSSSIKIILVTKNSKAEVTSLFRRIKKLPPNLPIVVADTIVYDILFPHSGDPLHIWIDSSRVIRYIAGGYNTNEEAISKFLNGVSLDFAYQTRIEELDYKQPFINEATTKLKEYTETYSVITKGLHNVLNTYRIEVLPSQKSEEPQQIKVLNASILSLLQLAYNKEIYGVNPNLFRLLKNHRVLLASDRAKLLESPSSIQKFDSWRDKNLYCYEIYLNQDNPRSIYKMMQLDLMRFFDYSISIEKKIEECLVLSNVYINSNDSNLTKSQSKISEDYNPEFKYENRQQMRDFILDLIYLTQKFGYPFFDGTSNTTNPKFKLPGNVNSLEELNQFLVKFDLRVDKRRQLAEFIVIK